HKRAQYAFPTRRSSDLVLMEFRNGLIEPIDLEQFLTELDPNTDTYRKLSDLRYIYQAFISEIAGKYIEREDIIKALIQKIESERSEEHTSELQSRFDLV